MQPRIWLAFACLVILATPTFAASRLMTVLDADQDGTIDIDEAIAAASAIFDRISDKQAIFDSAESRDHFKSNFLALTIKWFKQADLDGDGALDEDELRTPAGRKLEKLLRE
jgi:hypothetical protein